MENNLSSEPSNPSNIPVTADRVVFGTIFTADKKNKYAEAIAIKGKKIIYVGNKNDVTKYINKKTIIDNIDENKLIVPGLVDAHTHVNQLMVSRLSLVWDLEEEATKERILELIKEYIDAHPELDFYIVKGWEALAFKDEPYKIPTYHLLEGFTDKPLLCVASDGHSYWVNKPLLELSGVTKDTPNPIGGYINRDPETGEPLGLFTDTALYLIDNVRPPRPAERYENAIQKADEFYLKLGYLYRFQAIDNEPYNLLKTPCITYANKLDREGKLRCYEQGSFSINNVSNAIDLVDVAIKYRDETKRGNYELTTVKLFIDGIIENAGAYLSEPYSYWPGNNWRGTPRWGGEESVKKMSEIIAKANENDMGVHFHCMGDQATSDVLDAISMAAEKIGIEKVRKCRNAIAHLCLVKESDFKRFHDLNVIAVVNPWCVKDPKYYRVQTVLLGKDRAEKQYPVKSFLNHGVHVAFGTDLGASFTYTPQECFHALVTRLFHTDNPKSLLRESEKLSREEALTVMTYGGAYELRKENQFGSLSVGKDASLVVFSKNLLTIPDNEIMKASVSKSMYKGTWFKK